MHKTWQMPSRCKVALRVSMLTLLASFSACSHGGEPRHPLADGENRMPKHNMAEALDSDRSQADARSKHGVVHTTEAVPAPDTSTTVERTSDPVIAQGEVGTPLTSRRSRAAAHRESDTAPDDLTALPDPHVAGEEHPAPATDAPHAHVATQAEVIPPATATPAQPSLEAETQHFAYWPVYAGAGVAVLSILALALLRRRDRVAAQMQRDAERAHNQELEREIAEARETAARAEQARVATEAAAQRELAEAHQTAARLKEETRAAQAAAQAAAAEIAGAAEEAARVQAENERAQAAVAAAVDVRIHEEEQRSADPRIEAAHRLFDLLHRAERDVEPFLRMLDNSAPVDASTSAPRHIVASWHESMLSTRNRLAEALTRHNVSIDMQVVEPASDLTSAMSRLIDHAARMSALMVSQQQEESTILHWSRQLPGALIQLFWRAQTARYASTMPKLPKVPDAPAPSALRGSAPVPAQVERPVRTHDKAIQQALRAGQSHAVRN